jgi:hypothetical protein
MRRAVRAEAESLHDRIETSVGHWALGIATIGEEIDAVRRNESAQLPEQSHSLLRERHPVGSATLHAIGGNLPFGRLEIDLAPLPADDFALAGGAVGRGCPQPVRSRCRTRRFPTGNFGLDLAFAHVAPRLDGWI